MKTSVVIPLFNKRPYVAEAIASLAAQDLPPFEVIVVDDASTDGSLEVARRALASLARSCPECRVELIARPENGGPGTARNVGLEIARGELVGFLDADDTYRVDCLRKVSENLHDSRIDLMVLGFSDGEKQTFPDLETLAPELEILSADLYVLRDPLRSVSHPEFFMGRASNVMVRRRWLAAHRFHPTSRLNEGIDFWYRVLRDICATPGTRIGLMSPPLIRFRVLDDSLSHRSCPDWWRLEVPPVIRRYIGSLDGHDRWLMGMLGARWLEHAMGCLPSQEQKAAFVNHHRSLLATLSRYRLERR